jgi:hypothetical protein
MPARKSSRRPPRDAVLPTELLFRRVSGCRRDSASVRRLVLIQALLILPAIAAGCGGSSNNATPATSTQATTTPTPAPVRTTTAPDSPGALQAEANAAAAGDIPDNQVFLVYPNGHAGYSIKYPEGWAQQGSANTVVFRDKNNIVRIVVARAKAPTAATVARELQLKGVRLQAAPQVISLSGSRAFKVVYSTESAPNAVTGKRVTLVVDRYYLWRGSRRAVVDLGTPRGVDNVDAYRLMIESFRWR